MRRHTFYPAALPTVEPVIAKALRLMRWLLLALAASVLCVGAAMVILKLASFDAATDAAFLQGMLAGTQMCPTGI